MARRAVDLENARSPNRWSAVVAVDLLQKGIPAGAGFAVFEEDAGAILLVAVEVPLRPVVVGDDVVEGDILVVHEPGGEAGSAVDGCGLAGGVAQFANLDADAGVVAGAVMVGVFALDVEREGLDGLDVVDGEVPGHVAGAVPLRPAAKGPGGHAPGVLEGGGVRVVGGVDGDVGGVEGKFDMPSELAMGYDHLAEIDLRGSRALGEGLRTNVDDFLLGRGGTTAEEQTGEEDGRDEDGFHGAVCSARVADCLEEEMGKHITISRAPGFGIAGTAWRWIVGIT